MNELQELFKDPPKEYSPVAFWFWNDELDEAEIARQVKEMSDKGVYGGFMHARHGLKTVYFSDKWWNIVDSALEASKKYGFYPWLYDEYAWPSGAAGDVENSGIQPPSKTLAEGKVNMAKSLECKSYIIDENFTPNKIKLPDEEEDLVAIIKYCPDGKFKELNKEDLNNLSDSSDSVIYIIYISYVKDRIDYLNKNAIAKFIEYTHEEYFKRYGEYFGSLIPGIFFDEIYNAGKIPWTYTFREEFIRMKGYDLIPYLPMLFTDTDIGQIDEEPGIKKKERIRKDYCDIMTELHTEAFFRQTSRWCEKHNLDWTGHTNESILIHPLMQADYSKTLRHLQIPGTDNHCFRYRYPRTINIMEPKGASSVAHLYGRKRVLAEAMGGAGWAITLDDYKYGVNVLHAMGVNMIVPHGFYYSTDFQGAMDDWPGNWFFQNPYWKYFKQVSAYNARLSYIMSQGHHVCDVALYYPIDDLRMNTFLTSDKPRAKLTSDTYNRIIFHLAEHQIDLDIIDDDSILAAGIEGGSLIAADEKYKVLVLPNVETIAVETAEKLYEFWKNGGYLVFVGSLPDKCFDIENTQKVQQIVSEIMPGANTGSGKCGKAEVLENPDGLHRIIDGMIERDFIIEGEANPDFYYCHRKINENDFYLIVNTNRTSGHKIKVDFRVESKFAVKYDPDGGNISRLEKCGGTKPGYTQIELEFKPNEAYLVALGDEAISAGVKVDCEAGYSEPSDSITVSVPWKVKPFSNMNKYEWEIGDRFRIPVADFAELMDSGAQGNETRSEEGIIRERVKIANRDNEPGYCGRYVSSWKASWITLRNTWADDKSDVHYFRRRFIIRDLDNVSQARICMTAVRTFVLYVNGTVAAEGEYGKTTHVYDIKPYLKEGENVIAVKVINVNTERKKFYLHLDEYPVEKMSACMLAHVEIEYGMDDKEIILSDKSWIVNTQVEEGWNLPENDHESEVYEFDLKQVKSGAPGVPRGRWLWAHEMARPPVLPWGDLPLFGEMTKYPRTLSYKLTLPIGTVSVLKPEVKGEFKAYINGIEADFSKEVDGAANISPLSVPGELHIICTATDSTCGLRKPVEISISEVGSELKEWKEMGLDYYTGRMSYKNKVNIGEKVPGVKYVLDMGETNYFIEAIVNGQQAGCRIWPPYELDITELLQSGDNEIELICSNLLANEMYWDIYDEVRAVGWNKYWHRENIERDSHRLKSGILGPVKIIRCG